MARVIKLAQPGFDVNTTGDENLIYSSQWPLLPIAFQGSFTIPDVTVKTTILEHKLGFIPAFWFFTNTTIDAWQNGFGSTLVKQDRSEFFGPTGGGHIGINDNKLQFVPTSFTEIGSLTIYYYIFTIDITKLFQAPITKIGSVVGGSGDQGVFKIAKPNKNISSNNLSDFVIHSDCRSPLVHMVQPGTASTTANHRLGYNPMFFCYVENYSNTEPGFFELVFSGSGGTSVLSSTINDVIYQTSGTTGRTSILVLKDPFSVSYSRAVTI